MRFAKPYDGPPTLGRELLLHWLHVLPSPADQTKPLELTDEQAVLFLWWYAVDERGEFIYRRACLEMAKGWGKSPLLGAIAIAELSMPVRFDGWQGDGQPRGRPWGTEDDPPPWVQIAAVSEDQTDNTYSAIYEMLAANDGKAATALGIDEGRTRLYLRGKPGRLEPVTASAGAREGQRVTFAVLDETHLWRQANGGHKLARTIRRNAAKMDGRTFETTNAPELGEKSVAEQTGLEAENGERGILYYARRPEVEPDPGWTDKRLRAVVDDVYGDARWIDRDRIVREIRDPATPWGDTLRYYLNIRVPGGGKAVDPRRWDALAAPVDVAPGTPIGIGFDGSISQDATVLRGCTRQGYSFDLGHWVRPYGPEGVGWTVPRPDVHAALARAFETYRVGLVLADPPKWWSEIDEWARLYGEKVVLGLDTNQERRFAPAVDRWLTALREGTHTHDGDPTTTEHVKAACLRKAKVMADDDDQRTLHTLVKGEDGRRIDGAVADVLAFHAAMSMEEPPSKAREPSFAWA